MEIETISYQNEGRARGLAASGPDKTSLTVAFSAVSNCHSSSSAGSSGRAFNGAAGLTIVVLPAMLAGCTPLAAR